MSNATGAGQTLPRMWQTEVEGRLGPAERVLAWFEPDLDQQLRYSVNLVVLTDRRLFAVERDSAADLAGGDPPSTCRCQEWPIDPNTMLRALESGGIGTLELVCPTGRLAHWRYTAGRSADRLIERWGAVQQGKTSDLLEVSEICPSCGAPSKAAGICAACTPARGHASYSALRRLLPFARPHGRMIAVGFALTLAGTAASLVPPYLTMPLLDDVLIPYQNGQAVDFRLIVCLLAGLAGAALLAWLLDWARSYVLAWVSENVSADLRNRTYAHLQRLSLEFFGGRRTGDLIARISSDTDRLCNFLSAHLIDFATDILMMIMTAAILLAIDPWLALATLCPFPLIVWLVWEVRGRLLGGYRKSSVAWADLTSVLADTIPGIRVVKAFAQEQREIERFGHSNARVLSANSRLNRIWAFFGPTVTLLTTTGLLVVWAFAAWRVYHLEITVGVLTAFLAYIARFYARIESLIRMASTTQRAAASAQRIFEILDQVPSVSEPVRPIHRGRLKGRIEMHGVRFKYGTREVLHGIDLSIKPGEMIGLVGPSGAGKSTLINLICRFYDIAAGIILVDGVDIRSLPVEEYRRNIGIVLQDPFLFYGTVSENIAYGRPDASRAEVVAAARTARAHEFILRLPNGYDSLVGERGQLLSGGERQRIAIARALVIDPAILVLDEATSSVDTETERAIQAALENLIRGRTTIAIAHRLSTLRRADRIIVLEDGQITQMGSHPELLQTGGGYARLHRAQQEMLRVHTV